MFLYLYTKIEYFSYYFILSPPINEVTQISHIFNTFFSTFFKLNYNIFIIFFSRQLGFHLPRKVLSRNTKVFFILFFIRL